MPISTTRSPTSASAVGICAAFATRPRAFVLGGPLIHNRLFINTALQYNFQRESNRTLPFPHNESKKESINSFTQIDLMISPKQILTATLHWSPQHTNFVNPDYFNPQPVTPTYAQHNYVGNDSPTIGESSTESWTAAFRCSASTCRRIAGQRRHGDDAHRNRGNYFGDQSRSARRRSGWKPGRRSAPCCFGTHLIKAGTSLTGSGNDGQFTYRPVDILDSAGLLLERIDFTNRDLQPHRPGVTVFVQDHWAVSP